MESNRKEIDEIKKEISTLNITLASFNSNLDNINSIFMKVDGIIDKVYTLDSSIRVLEQKIDSSNADSALRRRESENSVREIKQQMSGMQSANEAGLTVKMDRVFSELKDLRVETKQSLSEVFVAMKENKSQLQGSITQLETRVSQLEKWRWWVMGVGIAVTTIFTLLWRTLTG